MKADGFLLESNTLLLVTVTVNCWAGSYEDTGTKQTAGEETIFFAGNQISAFGPLLQFFNQ
jgi:hypothetical protein